MKRDDGPTYEEVVQQILAAAGGPVAVDKLADGVLALKTTASKKSSTIGKEQTARI